MRQVDENVTGSRLGGYGELIAAAWLLKQGYEVFRNVCPVGPVDLVAMKDGKIELFDVKSSYRNKFGQLIHSKLSPEQKAMGVRCLCLLPDDSCVIDEEPDLSGVCEECGGEVKQAKRWTKRRFCSQVCTSRNNKRRKRNGVATSQSML